jgi:hypothetical protein
MAESVSCSPVWSRAVSDKSTRHVSYLGWHGRGNLGDDAIYDAVRGQLPGATLIDLPHFTSERIRLAATGLSRKLRTSPLVVGGGTVIGRRNWRRLVDRGLAINRHGEGYAIGVGVEDPSFGGYRSYSDNDELRQWPRTLAQFHTVSVRGPRSAELLADVGLDVAISGDPALLLPRPEVAPEDGLIGVNLGFGDDLWGHDPGTLATEVAGAVKLLAAQGYRFVGILMNPDDKQWIEVALKDVAADIVLPVDAVAAARELARCSVAIVSRLHAGILAALSDTPVISLEYQPKCRDFALSIGDERSLLRTDEVSVGAVVERVQSALTDSATIRTNTRSAVGLLRDRLQTEYGAVRRQLGIDDNR